jgi:putative hydrolase of HD superfamily
MKSMDCAETEGILTFIKRAENLKNTYRFSFTSTGKRESVAEHSWRVCLLVVAYASKLQGIDIEKCLKLAVIHDLAESICGDTPAIDRVDSIEKYTMERDAMINITKSLNWKIRKEIMSIWEEYEHESTDESKIVKALDKFETLIQHNQGLNPPDFNYAFNLTYGLNFTNINDSFVKLRKIIDEETKSHSLLPRSGPAQC